MTLHRMIAPIARRTVKLQGVIGDPDRGFTGENLRACSLLHIGKLHAAGRRRTQHQARRLELHRHVGCHPLQPLEFGDRAAELLALLQIRDTLLEGALRNTQRYRAGTDTLRVVGVHQRRKTFFKTARRHHHHRLVHQQISELQMGLRDTANAHRMQPPPNDQALRAIVFAHANKCANALLDAVIKDAREDQLQARHPATGDPVLLAVQHIVICAPVRSGSHFAGSAASEMRTRADRRADHYVLNGEKYWITGGGVSRLQLIFARVFDDGVEQGIGAFICVREDDGPQGLVIGRRLHAMGVRGIPETHLEFRDLLVHKSMMVVPPGGLKKGFAALMNAYNAQRVGAGTVALGIAQGAFEEGVAYLKQRQQFGRPIAEFQGLQWMAADMSVQLEAARLMLRAAAASGVEFPDMEKAARAKILAGETAIRVTNDALQFYGSSGYGRDHPMERHVRDARMFTIAGGTVQILRTQVASKLLGMKLPQTRDGFMPRQDRS